MPASKPKHIELEMFRYLEDRLYLHRRESQASGFSGVSALSLLRARAPLGSMGWVSTARAFMFVVVQRALTAIGLLPVHVEDCALGIDDPAKIIVSTWAWLARP
jgi:hypothetical protein